MNWELLTDDFNRSVHLFDHDLVVLLLLVVGLDALPWEVPFDEINQDVTDSFKVVSSGLLDAKVRVDRGISGSSCESLVLSVRDMLVSCGVSIFP